MNKIKTSLGVLSVILVAVILTSTSCKKAIDINSVGYVISDSAIRTEADLTALINSGYFALAADDYYGGSYQIFNELLGDHIAGTTLDGNYLAVYNRATTIFNEDVSRLYSQISKGIYQANLVLDHIDLASAANKNALTGQAKFMRGLCFFDLVRMYAQPYTAAGAASQAGIPLRLSGERQTVSRQTVGEVYTQIVKDLKEAEAALPSTNGVYASKWSAKAILAKVYFQMNDYANSYLYANDVITNGGFIFNSTYGPRYSPGGSTETIFGLVYEANNTSGRFQRLRNSYNTLGAALPALRLTNTFYTNATAMATDARKPWYSTKNGFYLLGKFDSASMKLPVIHLTELKLIRAEAAAESGSNLTVAITDMNDIIKRAYGTASVLILPPSATAAMIKDAARKERELELVGEGNWVQELKRRGAKGEPVSIRGSSYNCQGLIFPFPTNEVNYSAPAFIQNPAGGCN